MEGWIKLYRKFEDWEWYQDSKMVHLFIHLLINANHKDKSWKGITVKRGQVLTGRAKLSEATGLTIQQIRTCFNRLKSTSEITIKSTNKYSIITICKFDDYQLVLGEDQPADQPATQPTNNQQITTTKNVKKEKKKRNPPKSPQGEGPEKKENKNPTLTPEESLEYLPDNFHTPRFEKLWIGWWEYRKSERWTTKKSYAESSMRNLKKLAGEDVTLARKIVEQSMDQGWQGLFALKNGQPKNRQHGSTDRTRYDKPKETEMSIRS